MAVVYSNRRHYRARAISALCVLILGLATLPRVAAQSRPPERILSYDVTISVLPDSTMDVEESIRVAVTGEVIKHGIQRDFPTEYKDASGRLYEVGFQVNKVLRDGQPEPFTVMSMSNGKRVRIGRGNVTLSPGEYTYVIDYKTDHQLGFFEDHDELYWNATGFWPFAIDKATVHVHLPDGIPADQIRLTAYTGVRDAKGTDFTAEVADGVPSFTTTAPFDPYEGLTIVVGWPKGFVTQPPPVQRRAPRSLSWNDLTSGDWWRLRTIQDAGGTAMATCALLLLALLTGAWMTIGRDPSGRSIAVVYEPPEHLSPAVMRFTRVLKVDPKALTAAVLDMAAKKYLTIEKDGRNYVLVRTGNEANPPLSRDEELMAGLLFTSSDAMKIAREKFEAQLPDLKKNHPFLAKMAEGLAGMLEPDDPNRVRLGHSNPRLVSAAQATKSAVEQEFPVKTLMRTHAGVMTLAVMFTIAATILAVARYPGQLATDAALVPLFIFGGIVSLISDTALGHRLTTLLPAESFASERTVGKKIGNVIGLVIAAAFATAGGWLLALTTSVEWAAAFAFLWIEIILFSALIKQPTELGQRYWNEVEGFRQFLAEVDEDRLNRMNPPSKTPELFERMLPYALALDCEVVWAKKFESVLAMAATADTSGHTSYSPSWYSGPAAGMMNASAFTSAFASSFSSAIASSSTPPGSSSGFSGGGGGGGSSGGGGGGGGGGGW